jgi:hypothetical protein
VDDDDVATQWTDAARAVYATRAEEFIAALREHVASNLSRAGRQRELEDYFRSQTRVADTAHAFADAEFDWCGASPLPLRDAEGDDGWDDEGEEEDKDGTAGVLSVVGRWDFRVTDSAAVVEAGRQAYLRAWPDDTPDDAAYRVEDVGQAAGELMHGDDLAALHAAPGLQPYRFAITVVPHDGEDDFDNNPYKLAMDEDFDDD